ncbi:MAG: hypothetical protein GY786_17375 [Proteobacteria bacterium]|nr:hypothetical protein [Pseudomonadota bacterium]
MSPVSQTLARLSRHIVFIRGVIKRAIHSSNADFHDALKSAYTALIDFVNNYQLATIRFWNYINSISPAYQ